MNALAAIELSDLELASVVGGYGDGDSDGYDAGDWGDLLNVGFSDQTMICDETSTGPSSVRLDCHF